MARKSRRDRLAEQLDVRQQQAAYMLLNNELHSKSSPEYKTQEEIAAEIGVDRATLWRWRTQNQTFIEFRKEIARDYLGDMVGTFVHSLKRAMEGTNGAPSMRALDLYAKHIGFIKPDNQVDVNIGGGRSDDDLQAELERLDEQLAALEGESGDKEGAD